MPKDEMLHMKSSDPFLHTVHMDGAASFNLSFPFKNRIIQRHEVRTGAPGIIL